MKRKLLLIILGLLLIPIGMKAQWESGTSKTGTVSSKVHDVWFSITLPEDGQVDLTLEPLGNIGSENLTLYAVVDGENVQRAFAWVDGSNRTLTCPNLKPGTYKVKVNASLKNDKASGTFRLHYTFTAPHYKTDPTPNDTWDDCPLLQDGVTLDGHMGYAYAPSDVDDVDWFQIQVPKDGKLTFEVVTTSTLKIGFGTLNVLNADGTEVQQRNGMWLDKSDVSLVFEIPDVAAGTYYLRLPRYNGYGIYHLTPRFTPVVVDSEPEPNDTWDTATLLTDAQSLNAHLGYFYNSSIYNDDVDWFLVDVPEDGKLTFEARSSSTLTLGFCTLNTLNSDGTEVAQRNGMWFDKRDANIVFEIPDVSAGTYYFRVPRYGGYGNYSLTYYFTSHAAEADPEPNNTWDTATELKAGPGVTGQLGYDYQNTKDVEDWYVLNVPEEGVVTISVHSEPTLKIGFGEIKSLNADGTDTDRREGRWFDIPDTTLIMTLPNAAAGNYYLRLPHYSGYGTYHLRYNFTPCSKQNDAEPNDDFTTASEIIRGVTNDARIGYDYNNSMDTKDWYRFDVPEEGVITISVHSEPTLRLGYGEIKALSDDGTELGQRASRWFDIADSTLVLTLPNAAAGIYYLYMPHYSGYGGYTLKYDFTPCAYANDVADNDTWDTAVYVENGTTTQGRLGYDYNNSVDTKDWYQFIMEADGSATFTIQSEKTLKLGYAEILAPYETEEGTKMSRRASKWLDIPDSALVFKADNLAAGTYYLYIPHYSGYGGYSIKSNFTKNPYYRQVMTNTDFASRLQLEEGKSVYGTLGYEYNAGARSEAWFDLGNMHGKQIDVNVEVEQSHSLSISVATLYIYKGDNEEGKPILQSVRSERLERSSGTISYIDKNTEDSHYIFYLPRYNGYGGYKVTLGDEHEEGVTDMASNDIKVMTGGRNTVRKGVPCENPITVSNLSNMPSDFFLLAVLPTDNVNIIGFRMPTENGTQYIPVDSVTIPGENMCLFIVPKLLPWESYTFTMISEGKGDIAYAPERVVFDAQRRVIILGTAVTVAAIGAFAKTAAIGLATGFAIDWVSKKAGDAIFPADSEAATQYANLMGATKDQLGIRSSWDSPAVYTAKSFVSTCTTEATKKIVPKTGTVLDVVGNTITALQNIIPNLRRRIWYWIYKDLGYFDNNSLDVLDGKQAITDVVASWDPNEMVGPQGVGDKHYIGPTQTVTYRILFENKAEAGDAAYRVRVSDELDENVFDVSSVRFGETSHDGVGYNWEMTREGNQLTWDIKGIELPPNVNAPEGEGFVSFSVDLKPNLANGTLIKNKATIIFDKNYPIETNEYVNTLDLIAPTTTMSSADINATGDAFSVHCISDDAGSGVGSYLFFVSEDGGDYAYYGQSVTGSLDYPITPGSSGKSYSFYVLATDKVGNVERVIPQVIYGDTSVDGIRIVKDPNPSIKVYTIDGRYVGDTISGLKEGIYVVGGKKLFIK